MAPIEEFNIGGSGQQSLIQCDSSYNIGQACWAGRGWDIQPSVIAPKSCGLLSPPKTFDREEKYQVMTNAYWCLRSPLDWFNPRGSSIESTHQFSSRRSSSATSSASEQYGPPQVIRGSWIDEAKLKDLLEKKYRGHYKLRVSISDVPTGA